jgi:Ca2+-binding EF-hand superfamily protein
MAEEGVKEQPLVEG